MDIAVMVPAVGEPSYDRAQLAAHRLSGTCDTLCRVPSTTVKARNTFFLMAINGFIITYIGSCNLLIIGKGP